MKYLQNGITLKYVGTLKVIQNLLVVVVFPVKSGVRSFEVDWTSASHRSEIVGMIERFGTIYKDEGLKQ